MSKCFKRADTVTVAKVWQFLILCIFLLFLGWLAKINADGVSWYLDNDFAHFYTTAELVAKRQNPYNINLEPLYSASGFAPTRMIPYASAPPALAVLMTPLTLLSPEHAFVVWTIVQVSALLAGVFLLIRFLKLPLSGLGIAVVMLASIAPLGVFAHIRYGQTQLLMFFLVVVGLVALASKEPRLWRIGAVLWGVSVSLKLFTIPLAYVLLRYRGLAGLFWFSVGFFFLLPPFVALAGFESLETFLFRTIPYIKSIATGFDGNISLSAALVWIQKTLSHHEFVSAQQIQLLCALVLLPVMIMDLRATPDIAASTFIVLIASCLFSPTAWPHYLPLLLGSYLYAAAKAMRREQHIALLLCAVFLYVCLGSTLGVLVTEDLLTQFISAVWGPACMCAMMYMLCLARKIPEDEQIQDSRLEGYKE